MSMFIRSKFRDKPELGDRERTELDLEADDPRESRADRSGDRTGALTGR